MHVRMFASCSNNTPRWHFILKIVVSKMTIYKNLGTFGSSLHMLPGMFARTLAFYTSGSAATRLAIQQDHGVYRWVAPETRHFVNRCQSVVLRHAHLLFAIACADAARSSSSTRQLNPGERTYPR